MGWVEIHMDRSRKYRTNGFYNRDTRDEHQTLIHLGTGNKKDTSERTMANEIKPVRATVSMDQIDTTRKRTSSTPHHRRSFDAIELAYLSCHRCKAEIVVRE